jgi:hypothetical protein
MGSEGCWKPHKTHTITGIEIYPSGIILVAPNTIITIRITTNTAIMLLYISTFL